MMSHMDLHHKVPHLTCRLVPYVLKLNKFSKMGLVGRQALCTIHNLAPSAFLPVHPVWTKARRCECFDIVAFAKCRTDQCSKLNQNSCQSCCLETQVINIKLKKSFKKVPGPPPKLSALGWRTGSNLEHWTDLRYCSDVFIMDVLVGWRVLHHFLRQQHLCGRTCSGDQNNPLFVY